MTGKINSLSSVPTLDVSNNSSFVSFLKQTRLNDLLNDKPDRTYNKCGYIQTGTHSILVIRETLATSVNSAELYEDSGDQGPLQYIKWTHYN